MNELLLVCRELYERLVCWSNAMECFQVIFRKQGKGGDDGTARERKLAKQSVRGEAKSTY